MSARRKSTRPSASTTRTCGLLPLGKLRGSLATLPKDRPIITFCKVSLRGYEAQRILSGAGFTDVAFMEGGIATWPYELKKAAAPPADSPEKA